MTRARKRVIAGTTIKCHSPTEYSSPACLMHEFEQHFHAAGAPDVHIKRIYDEPDSSDGWRVLVDRLWPRGIRKQSAAIDVWARHLAPSVPLRQWFQHDPARWIEFRKRYLQELQSKANDLIPLRERSRTQRVTLLYATRDPVFNHAAVIMEMLRRD